jgi:hypothetical protein
MSAAWFACQTADAALHDEIADVLLDVLGDAAELGVEVGRAGDETLEFGGESQATGRDGVASRRPCPEPDGAPLVVFAFDGGITPLTDIRAASARPGRSGVDVFARSRAGISLISQRQMVGSDLDGFVRA